MKKILLATFIIILTATVTSCADDAAVNLVLPENKNIEVYCFSEIEIPLLTNTWMIESVKEMPSGNILLDKENNPISLDGNETIESSNGWFTISSKDKNSFTVNLKENFDKSNARNLAICINQNGERDYVYITQKAGTAYELVESTFEEIESKREIYDSSKECQNLTLTNNTAIEEWQTYEKVYMNVIRYSEFQSDDYGAFDWMSADETEIIMPDLLIDGNVRDLKNTYTYKEGVTTEPYNGGSYNGIQFEKKFLVPPHGEIHLSGKMTYCKRIVNYTFTIRNITTGTQSDITGIWTQIVPIATHTTVSDKPL